MCIAVARIETGPLLRQDANPDSLGHQIYFRQNQYRATLHKQIGYGELKIGQDGGGGDGLLAFKYP